MIDERKSLDQPIKNGIKAYEKIKKLLLVKEMITQLAVFQIILISKKLLAIAIELSKQQTFDADPKAIQQVNFN